MYFVYNNFGFMLKPYKWVTYNVVRTYYYRKKNRDRHREIVNILYNLKRPEINWQMDIKTHLPFCFLTFFYQVTHFLLYKC